MKMMIECQFCQGQGQFWAGVVMHANPYSYASYDEVWDNCPECQGLGQVRLDWKHRKHAITWTLKKLWRLKHSQKHGDMPVPF